MKLLWMLCSTVAAVCISNSEASDCECVPYYLCNPDKTINTNGLGLIDIRDKRDADDICENYLHDCCKKADVLDPETPSIVAGEDVCLIPEPLAHGSYKPHHRRCPSSDDSAACRLVPGAAVRNRWLIFYKCNADYQLSRDSRASICKDGHWLPELPTCLTALNLISRASWGAEKVASTFPTQLLPVKQVIIAHTATPVCKSRPECEMTLQFIEQFYIQHFGDIGYNFLVGGDGSVFEGQGWRHIGAHTLNYNRDSISVALIGNFVRTPAPEIMLETTRKLIDQGVAMRKIARNYKLYAQCQLLQIASPGKKVFDEIKLWPNWNNMNASRCTQ